MIIKTRQAAPVNGADDGWCWIDGIESVRNHGMLTDENGDLLCTADWNQIVDAVNRTWGSDRAFTREVWPERLDQACYITVVVGRKPNDDGVLVLIANEDAFLLSDAGKTVDRLR